MSKGNPRTANLVIEWSPNGVTTFDGITRSTQRFDSMQAAAASVRSRSAIVAVSRRFVFIRTTRVPNAAASDVRLVLSMRLGDLFPIPAHELAYDFILTDDVDPEGRLAIVAAMGAQDLRKLNEDLRVSGIKAEQVLPVAFGSALLVESLGVAAAAVVSRDDEGMGIDVVEGGQLRYSRLSSSLSTPSAEVSRTFAVAGVPTSDTIGAGGYDFPDANRVINGTALESLLSTSAHFPTINLELPEVVALRAKRIRDNRQRLALVLFIAALGMCGWAYLGYSWDASFADIADRKAKDSVKKLDTQLKGYQATLSTVQDAQTSLDLGFKYGQKYSDIATTVAADVPKDVWLNGISVERGKRLLFRGIALNNPQITAYIHKLSDEPRLRNVKLEFANDASINQKPVVQFTISAFPVGNVPLNDPTKVKRK